jgi:hypothetical protein
MKQINPTECDYCHAKMVFVNKSKVSWKKYTRKSLKCPICGYEKTIYAGGVRDDFEAEQAINEINKRYKKEEKP